MFGDTKSCEVHLIDVTPSDHPTEVEVEVVARLRDVREFATSEALMEQMTKDIENARAIL